MVHEQKVVQRLYSKLLSFYPRAFRERFGESIEQTFNDLYYERKRQTEQGVVGFVLWMFWETVIGIVREHLLLVSLGAIMQTIRTHLGPSTLIGFLFILPFMILEVVNRRNFSEDFPFMLFFVLWLNLFAVSLILLPIVRSRRSSRLDMMHPTPPQGNTLFTHPRSTAMISILLFLVPVSLFLLQFFGWGDPLNRLFNGPDPEQPYVLGQIISLALISLPVAAGIIAGGPIVRTLRAGGSLVTHPLHLVIVIVISFLFIAGVVGLIVDQWPCFLGVPNCD
ncbi:MAG: hypothetical protein R3E79_07610 [Caldilineaceae bacterium]